MPSLHLSKYLTYSVRNKSQKTSKQTITTIIEIILTNYYHYHYYYYNYRTPIFKKHILYIQMGLQKSVTLLKKSTNRSINVFIIDNSLTHYIIFSYLIIVISFVNRSKRFWNKKMNIVTSPMCLGRPQEVLNPYIIVSSYFKYVKFNDFKKINIDKMITSPTTRKIVDQPTTNNSLQIKRLHLEQVYK